MLTNRRWILAQRPSGKLSLDDFRYDEQQMDEPVLAEGDVLVRTSLFACAPTIRNWMNDASRSYRGSVGIGEPIMGVAGGEVIASRHPDYPIGSRISGVMGWQDYCLIAPDTSVAPALPVAQGTDLSDAMGILGNNALTGYCGLLYVGVPKPGETVVVSAAAGSVGSVAAQVARIKGCRVIGIAGGKEKCDWLLNEIGLDGAIDYKSQDVRARLAELCPDGVNVFFDNVGGDILQAVMANIAVHGRVVVCGQVSAYDSDVPARGPDDMMKVVYWRVRIEGFVLGDFGDKLQEARSDLAAWHADGLITFKKDIRQGFEALPATFLDLFTGSNSGALMVRTGDVV